MKSFGSDAPVDGEGNVKVGEPSALTYWTIFFQAPEDEFIELGAPDDPLLEAGPHAILQIRNMTIPENVKTRLYGRARITLDFEVDG